MGIPASQIFNFIGKQKFHKFERHFVYSENYDNLRRSVRKMVMLLRDSDDVGIRDISVHLRILISKCLCSPVNFDHNLSDELEVILGDINSTADVLGKDIADLYKISLHAVSEMQKDENPLRVELCKTIQEIMSSGRKFKVFCTKRDREYFDSLQINSGETKLKDENFIYTLPQYRESEFFDELIKIGPFRSRGWSSAPDAILTSPSFKRLIQILWNGCDDENDFGYDPVTFIQNADEIQNKESSEEGLELIGPMRWKKLIYNPVEIPRTNQIDDLLKNEFEFYMEKDSALRNFSVNLIQIDSNTGIFKKTKSKLLTYNLKRNNIDNQILEESSPEGLFLIETKLENVDFGVLRAKSDQYSQIWKEKLEFESQVDMNGLVKKLKNDGVDLINLEQAIKNIWIKPTERVIHAPHSMHHFRILLNVLGFGEKMEKTPLGLQPFWKLASSEISRSRGEAIQTGLQEQQTIDEELIKILFESIPEISSKVIGNSSFKLKLNPSGGLSGFLFFYKILSIESGFTVPQSEIDRYMSINFCDQWRD